MNAFLPAIVFLFCVSCNFWTFKEPAISRDPTESGGNSVGSKFHSVKQLVNEAGRELTRMEVKPFVGSVIIARGKDFSLVEAFGDRIAGEAKMTPDTVFPLASLTKLYSAVLLRKALDLKAVDVKEPVEKYLDNVDLPENPGGSPITIIQLVKHLGGFPQRLPEPRPFTEIKLRTWLFENRKFIEDSGKYQYSTFSYSILGMVTERLLGQNFSESLRELIIKPLRLTSTAIRVSDLERKNLVGAYKGLNRVEIKEALDDDFGRYSGGLMARADEYSKFLELWVQTSKTDLSMTALSTLQTDGFDFPDHPFYLDASMGWHVVKDGGYFLNSAFGEGYHHTTWYDPKTKVMVAILTNTTFETATSEPDQSANGRLEQISARLMSAIAALN